MAFDIFSQPTGPNIPVSLYGDAAKAGAAVGNSIATPLQAGIEGVIKGIQTGQDIALKQEQVDEIPLRRTMLEQQVQNGEAIATINALKAKREQQTDSLELQDETAQLQNDVGKNQAAIDQRNREAEFTKAYDASTPQQRAQLVLSGQYQDVFDSNPKAYNSRLQQIYLDPYNGLDDQTRQNIGVVLRRSNAADPWNKVALQRQQAFNKVQTDLLNDSDVTGTVANNLGILPTEVPYKTQLLESGKFQKNQAGTALLKDNDGNFIPIPYDKQSQPSGKYDVITPDGQIVFPDASKETKKLYHDYKYENDFQQGKFSKIAADKVTPKPAATVQPQNQKIVIPDDEREATAFKAALHLDDRTFSEIKPALGSLKTSIELATAEPEGINNLYTKRAVDRAISSTARSITDAQYESNPVIRQQYTPEKVAAYNTAKQAELAVSLSGFKSPYLPSQTIKAFSVSDPKELYFVTQRDAIESQLSQLTYKMIQQRQNDVLAKGRSVQASKANAQFLAAISNGANP